MQYTHLGRSGLSVPVCIWAPRISVHSPMPEFTCTVPFALGARQVLNWFDANPDQQIVDKRLNTVFDQLITTPRPQ
jgi:hypothetical protein